MFIFFVTKRPCLTVHFLFHPVYTIFKGNKIHFSTLWYINIYSYIFCANKVALLSPNKDMEANIFFLWICNLYYILLCPWCFGCPNLYYCYYFAPDAPKHANFFLSHKSFCFLCLNILLPNLGRAWSFTSFRFFSLYLKLYSCI